MTVGERIKERRIALNLSQDELAKKVGYKSRSSIQKIECARALPLKKVAVMARALDCSPSYLMGWAEEDGITTVDLTFVPDASEEELKRALEYYKRLQQLPPEKQAALRILLEMPEKEE